MRVLGRILRLRGRNEGRIGEMRVRNKGRDLGEKEEMRVIAGKSLRGMSSHAESRMSGTGDRNACKRVRAAAARKCERTR
jgi:hypothetical protein